MWATHGHYGELQLRLSAVIMGAWLDLLHTEVLHVVLELALLSYKCEMKQFEERSEMKCIEFESYEMSQRWLQVRRTLISLLCDVFLLG